MRGDDALRRQLEADLERFNGFIEVTAARVALQQQRETTPAYQAVVILGVPGADIHAAARDHTWAAAWGKVMARLREQIEERQTRQKDRHPNRQLCCGSTGDRVNNRKPPV